MFDIDEANIQEDEVSIKLTFVQCVFADDIFKHESKSTTGCLFDEFMHKWILFEFCQVAPL